jgi:hypothetical protein
MSIWSVLVSAPIDTGCDHFHCRTERVVQPDPFRSAKPLVLPQRMRSDSGAVGLAECGGEPPATSATVSSSFIAISGTFT